MAGTKQLALLAISGQTVVSPGSSADPAAVFKELGAKLNLDEKVIKFLVDTEKIASLDEFCKMATNEQEVGEIIKQVPNLERSIQQTARLRLAWTAVRDTTEKAVVVRKQEGEPDDLDKLLPIRELDDMNDLFWAKHRLTFEPDDEPSDSLVSRVAREIAKRLLTSRDVWATKSLTFQQRQEKKKTRIAEGLELVHSDTVQEAPVKHNIVN